MPPPSSTPVPRSRIAPHHLVYLSLVLTPIVVFTVASVYSQSHAYNVYLSGGGGGGNNDGVKNAATPVKSFFAQRSNFINVYFIKYAWAWTTVAWLAQVRTLRIGPAVDVKGKGRARDDDDDDAAVGEAGEAAADPKPPSAQQQRQQPQRQHQQSPVARSMVRYMIATTCWIFFAVGFFGPPIMERILTASGGICLPRAEGSVGLSNPSGDATRSPGAFRMPEMRIDEAFCRAGRRGISREERPDLFRTAHALVTDGVGEGRLIGRWKGGHDISGHIFILSLSTLFLLEDLSPYLAHFITAFVPRQLQQLTPPSYLRAIASPRNPFVGTQRTVNAAVAAFVLSLVTLWVFCIVNTSLFFHTPLEKFSGALVGIAAWAVLPKSG